MKRIVVWGATGYTGGLVADALAAWDLPVVLAGRDETRLRRLRDELPGASGWSVAVADAARPDSVQELVDSDAVVVATAGPFNRIGWPAAQAAAESGAAYLDSCGEPPFVRRVHDALAVSAERAHAVLAPAFGYEYVPGQVAAAHALSEAPGARAIRVGYFTGGRVSERWTSGGTLASVASVMAEPSFAWRHGRLQRERPAARVASISAGGRTPTGLSLGGAEHVFLPQTFSGLRDVDVYLGWAGSWSRWAQVGSAVSAPLVQIPGARKLVDRAMQRLVRGSTGGPSADERALVTTLVAAEALDDDGVVVARTELSGPNPYDLTAKLLAAASQRLLFGRASAPSGVVGPLELFGVEAMLRLAEEVGLRRTV